MISFKYSGVAQCRLALSNRRFCNVPGSLADTRIVSVFILVLTVLTGCIGMISCSKDDSNLIMTIYPANDYIVSRPDTTIRFVISANSEVNIRTVRVTQDVVGSPLLTLLDTVANTRFFSRGYDMYIDPKYQGETLVLQFYCNDESGKSFSVLRRLFVSKIEEPLKETSGHIMYSLQSGKECAYDLIKGEGISLSDTIRPKDIQDNTTDSTSQELSRSWISPYGLQFVLYNEFDYANATTLTAENGYKSGLKLTELNNLAAGNILITKITRAPYIDYYVVIKITNVFNNLGTQDDLYLFNLKKK